MAYKGNTNSLILTFSVLAIALAIPVTFLLSQSQTNSQQEAAMKMSPMPSQMPGNNKTVLVRMVHKGMSMNMGGATPMVEESDSSVDAAMMAGISPTPPIGNNNGNMCGNNNDMFFSPKVVTIQVGTTVKWLNTDPDMKHDTSSIRRRGAESWDSGDLKPGESFSHTFTHVGIYPYDCDIHPWMRGVVRVIASLSPAPSMPMASGSPMPSKMPKPSKVPMGGAGM